MRRANIKVESEIEKFRRIQEKVEALVVQKAQKEVDYGEIPDEFRGESWMIEVTLWMKEGPRQTKYVIEMVPNAAWARIHKTSYYIISQMCM